MMRSIVFLVIMAAVLAQPTTPLHAQDRSGGPPLRSTEQPAALPPTDTAIRVHYLAHPHDYDEYELSHIFIAVAGRSRSVSTARTLFQACVLAREIATRLRRGEHFEDLASTYSEDAESRSERGHLPSMFRRYMLPVFDHTVGALKAGDVSKPILGPEGIHIIKVDAVHYAGFERAKGLVGVELRGEGPRIRPLRAGDTGSGSLPSDCSMLPKA